MKKLFLFCIVLLLVPIWLLAESNSPGTGDINAQMFATFAGLSAGIAALTALVKPLINTVGFFTDLLSWCIGLILGIIAWKFQLGMFTDMSWYLALITGLMAAMGANKSYDVFCILKGSKSLSYRKA